MRKARMEIVEFLRANAQGKLRLTTLGSIEPEFIALKNINGEGFSYVLTDPTSDRLSAAHCPMTIWFGLTPFSASAACAAAAKPKAHTRARHRFIRLIGHLVLLIEFRRRSMRQRQPGQACSDFRVTGAGGDFNEERIAWATPLQRNDALRSTQANGFPRHPEDHAACLVLSDGRGAGGFHLLHPLRAVRAHTRQDHADRGFAPAASATELNRTSTDGR